MFHNYVRALWLPRTSTRAQPNVERYGMVYIRDLENVPVSSNRSIDINILKHKWINRYVFIHITLDLLQILFNSNIHKMYFLSVLVSQHIQSSPPTKNLG